MFDPIALTRPLMGSNIFPLCPSPVGFLEPLGSFWGPSLQGTLTQKVPPAVSAINNSGASSPSTGSPLCHTFQLKMPLTFS